MEDNDLKDVQGEEDVVVEDSDYSLSEEEQAEADELATGYEPELGEASDESQVKEPETEPEREPELAPEMVTNAVYFPDYFRDGVTDRHGEVPPIKFRYKPMTDEKRMEFFSVMSRSKKVTHMRLVGYKMLAKHVIETSLCVPDTENEGEFVKMDVTSHKLWKFVDPNVIQDMLDAVIGEVTLPEGVQKNL